MYTRVLGLTISALILAYVRTRWGGSLMRAAPYDLG